VSIKERGLRIWTRLAIVIVLVLASVLGCKPKTDLPPTLVATLALPTNASATPPPTTLQVEPPLTLTAGASEDTATPTETPLPTPTP